MSAPSPSPSGIAARLGLIALLALVAALLLFSSAPAAAQSPSAIDYDSDNDNLIEISSLAQLNAIRWDLDGNGTVDAGTDQAANQVSYEAAFANADSGMGCAATCRGYELTADLDFDEDGGGVVNADDHDGAYWDDSRGWIPIGAAAAGERDDKGNLITDANRYNAVFEGNGHVISNLYIRRARGQNIGLFGVIGTKSAIRNVGLENVNIIGGSYVGALAGHQHGQDYDYHRGLVDSGTVEACYSTGSVNGSISVGGLVGSTNSRISTSYSTASVTVRDSGGGGLVGSASRGSLPNSTGEIRASYATGAVTRGGGLVNYSINTTASYSTGSTPKFQGRGLVGSPGPAGVTDSYWDMDTSGQDNVNVPLAVNVGGEGKRTAELQSPTGYTGIYATWNLDIDNKDDDDSDSTGQDDPWDFGTASQYPALRVDFNNDGVATAYEFGGQGRPDPAADYDADDDGLIEVDSLVKLNAIRWDLDGNGSAVSQIRPKYWTYDSEIQSDWWSYNRAFPTPVANMGCGNDKCTGYELAADLDFDENSDSVITDADAAWWDGGRGWAPIGSAASPYNAVFEGYGHTISHLFIDRARNDDIGLFGYLGESGAIRNLGLEDVNVTGNQFVGALAGQAKGRVATSYSTGSVGGAEAVGGLVGHNDGSVAASYSNADVFALAQNAGGLVGLNRGVIKASYATGTATAANSVGGLVGSALGQSEIVASYSTGWVASIAIPKGQNVGGLIGLVGSGNNTVTNSYWDTRASGQTTSSGGVGHTSAELYGPTGYSGIYANWNLDLDGANGGDELWDFGTPSQYPALKADFDNNGTPTAAEFGDQVRSAPSKDYDADDDGLIEIYSLAQLNAIRWDLDGDGAADNSATAANTAGYAAAFRIPMPNMGCLNDSCTGYELKANLNFDEDGDGDADERDYHAAFWNSGDGWEPIGDDSTTRHRYSAVFEGNGHTITNLFISRPDSDHIGLFGHVSDGAVIRKVGLERVSVRGKNSVGALAGWVSGKVASSYSTGSVAGAIDVGGLVGLIHLGDIETSYSNARVARVADAPALFVGGLVGRVQGGDIKASYSTGAVSGADYVGGLTGYVSGGSVAGSYSTGRVSSTARPTGKYLGGLTGGSRGTATDSYWDTGASAQPTSSRGVGKTTAELQSPTGYTGIYANWNLDLDGGGGDDPWSFGTTSEYPALKVDFNNDRVSTTEEFGTQTHSAPKVDYDKDNDRLIEVSNLAQLNAIRWDLDGNGASGDARYASAFYNPVNPVAHINMGCSDTCIGYELTADLYFDENRDGEITDADAAWWNGGSGWEPIGSSTSKYNIDFQGNGRTISHLFINRPSSDYVGLFAYIDRSGRIRKVGLESVNVNGHNYVGAVAGKVSGSVQSSYSTGSVAANWSVGGLAGYLDREDSRTKGTIETSYSNASVTATDNQAGGLLGYSKYGIIRASYATGAVSGGDLVGGLVGGSLNLSVSGSYSTGSVSATKQLQNVRAGGLIGYSQNPVTTNSYWDTGASGMATSDGGAVGKTTTELQTPTGYTGIYANWNRPHWHFGNVVQYPALKADFNGDGRATVEEFGSQNRAAAVDYDSDDDGLIDVSNLAQLNAMRWDLDGDGRAPTNPDYHAVFSGHPAGMGCPGTCAGYELLADLDFNTNTAGDTADKIVIDDSDDYWNGGKGWDPIGEDVSTVALNFNTVFEGNKHTISNLYIDRPTGSAIGLFGVTGPDAAIRNVGLEGVSVKGKRQVGALVGYSGGPVESSYSTGHVRGDNSVGGLAGVSANEIKRSYSTARVTASAASAGGLVGLTQSANGGSSGAITASYATGRVSGASSVGGLVGSSQAAIKASYSTSKVAATVEKAGGLVGEMSPSSTVQASYAAGPVSAPSLVGGLVGRNAGAITASYARGAVSGQSDTGGLVGKGKGSVTDSYWDTVESGQASSDGSADSDGKSSEELGLPTGYDGIYSAWNLDLDGSAGGDDPWDFGTKRQYPALKVDFDNDNTASVEEFGRQTRAVSVDYDIDNNGLIEIYTLAQLNAVRWDLNGDGKPSSSADYTAVFSRSATGMGCPWGDHDADSQTPDQPHCTGYELMAALDFNTDTTGDTSGGIVIDDKDDYWNDGSGWNPIGDAGKGYQAVFQGNGNTISNLFISRSSKNLVGLFGLIADGAAVRNLGLEDANVTGANRVGALAGNVKGSVKSSYSTGSVSGAKIVGGLAGGSSSGGIQTSYSTADVTGTGDAVGGLVGENSGAITASYATGAVTGADYVGGLVGQNRGITTAITASYATGVVIGSKNFVGGLMGSPGLTVKTSYWDVTTSGHAGGGGGGVGKTTTELQSPAGYNGIYADWNLDLDNADNDDNLATNPDDPWDFGTTSEYPVLKVDFNNDKMATAAEFGSQPRAARPSANGMPTFDGGTITGGSLRINFSVPENGGTAVGTLTATDPENDPLTYELVADWRDDGAVTVDSRTGVITLKSPADHEAKPSYEFEVLVRDSKNAAGGADTRWDTNIYVIVSVDDVDEPPGSPTGLKVAKARGGLDVSWTAPAAIAGTPAVTGYEVEYALRTAASPENWGDWQSHAHSGAGTSASIRSLTSSTTYRVQVRALNGEGNSGWLGPVSGVTGAPNRAPVYADSTKTLTVPENTPVGTNVGSPLTAVDPEGETLSYSLEATADDAHFAVDAGSGQLWVKEALNYEEKSSHSVTVTAEDTSGQTGSITVTINVGDLKELPGAPRDLKAAASVNRLTVSWTAPAGPAGAAALPITRYDLQYRRSTVSGWTSHSHADATTTAAITGLTARATYNVRVRAWNADGAGPYTKPVNGAPTAPAPGGAGDHDKDNDNLLDIDSLAKLNAIRWDLTGGVRLGAGGPDYLKAFPRGSGFNSQMGCPGTCIGYELTADLDFDQNGDGRITAADTAYWNNGAGWLPIGTAGTPYTAVFEGNGHTISNLFIDRRSTDGVGLFGGAGGAGLLGVTTNIRNLGLERVVVKGHHNVGALAGLFSGTVTGSYATGSVSGHNTVGGLVGQIHQHGLEQPMSLVSESYATGSVSGKSTVGGLVGEVGNQGVVRRSYATGSVAGLQRVGGLAGRVREEGMVNRSYADSVVTSTGSFYDFGGLVGLLEGGVKASYARGSVSGAASTGGLVGALTGTGSIDASYAANAPGKLTSSKGAPGGLVGFKRDSGTARNSYWNSETSSWSSSAVGNPMLTTDLQSPTGYTGIYAHWNLNLDGAGGGDNPWDFGTAKQYPALKADLNGDGTATVEEFGRQKRYVSAVDYDRDDDNLIEVSSLAQLDAMRWDLNGDGVPSSDIAKYDAAFPTRDPGMGCPDTCLGYELTANLDFDENGDRVITAADTAYWGLGAGWWPIGNYLGVPYNAVFEGNGHTISHLFINLPGPAERAGLFRDVGPAPATSATWDWSG